MRLSDDERQIICKAADAPFGAGCIVRLFGSRVDDARRGGDIDLHLEPVSADRATVRREVVFASVLRDLLGDPKIDVVVKRPGAELRPIDRIALAEGIEL